MTDPQAIGILKTLQPGDYHVTVVSPDTYNTFTPLLPCTCASGLNALSYSYLSIAAAVGTVQVRSLMEPLRKLIARVRGHFVQGYAVDLVMGENLLEVQTKTVDGTTRNIYLPYVRHVLIPYMPPFPKRDHWTNTTALKL